MFQRSVISCDIQPRYATGVPFELTELVQYLNGFDKILYLFNDKRINTPDTKEDIIKMLKEKGGATDELFKKIEFRPKVFFYFRDILDDNDATFEECVKLLKMIILRGVENASELSAADLHTCLSSNRLVHDIKSNKRQFYYDPSLATDLIRYNNSIEIGGFENQCNIEIEIYLEALGLTYEKNYKFIF